MITKRDESADTGRKWYKKKNLDLFIYSLPLYRHINQEAIDLNIFIPNFHFTFLFGFLLLLRGLLI
jgi:hypothetical protein